MPRYYFHLTDGKQVLKNHRGIDLPGNAACFATFMLHLKIKIPAPLCRAGAKHNGAELSWVLDVG